MEEEKRPGLARRGAARGRRALAGAGTRADRVLDRAQADIFRLLWFFLPEPAVARKLWFQHLLVSRVFSEAGQQSVAFGSLIAVARDGGSTFQLALIGVVSVLPPALLGLYGGAIADAVPKRAALGGIYALQAAFCFIIPAFFGTSLVMVLVLIFIVNTLGQVSGPSEASVLPLVASEEELASAASLINLAAAGGAALGTALLAPVLVKATSVNVVLYVAGGLLLLSASRVFDLPVGDRKWAVRFDPPLTRARAALRWLSRHPAVATMIIVAVLAGTVNLVLQTMAPRYVQDVLDADPADTAYVFAPSAAGLVLALLAAPLAMKQWGERLTAVVGFLAASIALVLLGLPGDVASLIDPVNPMRVVGLAGIDLSEKLRAAALLAVPLAFGVSLTATSVQTYINRRVPLVYQGRTFALQSSLRNGAGIVPLLTLGGAASLFGVQGVLIASPVVLLLTAHALIALSFGFSSLAPAGQLQVMESFWAERRGGRRTPAPAKAKSPPGVPEGSGRA